jgi:hypothetical protein
MLPYGDSEGDISLVEELLFELNKKEQTDSFFDFAKPASIDE